MTDDKIKYTATSINISKKLAEQLKIIAIKQGTSRNTIIRNIIENMIKTHNNKNQENQND